MDLLLTYDVSSKQSEVKKELDRLDYWSYFYFRDKIFYLPNSTVWKKNTSDIDQAIIDLQNIAASLSVKLERAIAIPFGYDWRGIPGRKPGT